jgi:hypothetical protein
MELTAQNVNDVFMFCMFKDDEVAKVKGPEDFVLGDGVMVRVGFHPERLQQSKENVRELLSHLSSDFMTTEGGGKGSSFLNACMTKTGVQWGEHKNVDELLMLGLALGFINYCLPREKWNFFPGGMPYFAVTL